MALRDALETMASTAHIKVESIAPAASYATNGIGFTFGAFTLNQAVMITTLALGLATFVANLYFQKRRDRREQEFHRIRMEKEQGKPMVNSQNIPPESN